MYDYLNAVLISFGRFGIGFIPWFASTSKFHGLSLFCQYALNIFLVFVLLDHAPPRPPLPRDNAPPRPPPPETDDEFESNFPAPQANQPIMVRGGLVLDDCIWFSFATSGISY